MEKEQEKQKQHARPPAWLEPLSHPALHGVTNLNRVKPGIAEATRAVMRRVPEHVLVHNENSSDVQLLIHLADLAGIKVKEARNELGPYQAITIIQKVG